MEVSDEGLRKWACLRVGFSSKDGTMSSSLSSVMESSGSGFSSIVMIVFEGLMKIQGSFFLEGGGGLFI